MAKQLYEIGITKKNYSMRTRLFVVQADNETMAIVLAEKELKRNSFRGEVYVPVVTTVKQITHNYVKEVDD